MKSKIAKDPFLTLEDSVGANSLIKVKTSKKTKREIIEAIRRELKYYINNNIIQSFKDKNVDLAIIVYVRNSDYKRQDVDNIAKIVLDALSKNGPEDKGPYIFNNDSQIKRLLVHKIKQTKSNEAETDQFIISFREYDPKKQMIMRNWDAI
jgi:Holliday junction resolvase RusA-like endonuclease